MITSPDFYTQPDDEHVWEWIKTFSELQGPKKFYLPFLDNHQRIVSKMGN